MIKTNGDVRAAIARAGVKHMDVAKLMKIDPATFSAQTKDRQGKPSASFVAKFEDALDVLTNGVTTEA